MRKEYFGMAAAFLGPIAAIGLILLAFDRLSARDCRILGETEGRAIRYYALNGCYVERDGKWLGRFEYIITRELP
jgi:hypothetical protein